MGAAWFYHMTRKPLEETLPVLLTRAQGQGWRVAIRGTDPARIAWLDEKLWLLSDDGFLPHGVAGGAFDTDQPVLLTTGTAVPNGATYLVAIDGAEVTPDEVAAMKRVSIMFDGHDPDALARARAQWKALTAAGCAAAYWSEESGRWEKKAETG
ncbi:MAG: DNA polymerase III subunit chi [Rhodobacteraceae bacterium]|jgi:DNA polymerase-3 subunit chi|nr:DNA polymerase III subunit chi [Paracoccaceae bacterium]